MKVRRVLVILFFLLLFCFTGAQAKEGFDILLYEVRMDVQDDHSVILTETIDVEFTQQLHGIYRTIPLQTHFNTWGTISHIQMLSSHPYTTTREGGFLKIRIGDANKWAAQKERYQLTYQFHLGHDGLDTMDELYYNLIGNGWNTNINEVRFEIHMPHPFDSTNVSMTYGLTFSQEKDQVQFSVDGQHIAGFMTRRLGPYEGLTIAIPLPEGYFSAMPIPKDYAGMLRTFGPPLYLSLLLLGFALWQKWGRNQPFIPTVEFYAPSGLTSADLGYIFDNQVDNEDLLSLIIYWASQGYLRIEEKALQGFFASKPGFVFHRLADLPDSAKPYEKKMFQDLFRIYGNGDSVSDDQLKNHFYKTMESTRKLLLYGFTHRNENRIFGRWVPFVKAGLILLAILISFASHFALTYAFFPEPLLDVLGITMVIYPTSLLVSFGAFFLLGKVQRGSGWSMKIAFFMVGLLQAALLVGFAIIGSMENVLLSGFLGYLASLVLIYLTFRADQRTALGHKYMEQLMGFRQFLLEAEQDRIEMLSEQNPEYFYNILPYAMVLGVSERWAKKFEHFALTPPAWYVSSRPDANFNSWLFYRSLSSSMSTMSASMTAMPSQRGGGSSGGGFSGGGSGGGGGGGW